MERVGGDTWQARDAFLPEGSPAQAGDEEGERLAAWYEEQRLGDFCRERERLYLLLLWEEQRREASRRTFGQHLRETCSLLDRLHAL